jgi:hypothetical protein
MNDELAKANCEEKTSLLKAYQQAVEAYSSAVGKLARKIGVSPKVDFDDLNSRTELARYKSLDAKDRLERHIAEHGC